MNIYLSKVFTFDSIKYRFCHFHYEDVIYFSSVSDNPNHYQKYLQNKRSKNFFDVKIDKTTVIKIPEYYFKMTGYWSFFGDIFESTSPFNIINWKIRYYFSNIDDMLKFKLIF